MPVDMDIMEPVIIATSVMTIPFIFMLIAWKKNLDRSVDYKLLHMSIEFVQYSTDYGIFG